MTDDDDDDDDGAASSGSDSANDLACDLSQPTSTPQDIEDRQSSVQEATVEPETSTEKATGWVNNRRRKSSRPQWHYEGTVLDKSKRLTVNGTTDDSSYDVGDGSRS